MGHHMPQDSGRLLSKSRTIRKSIVRRVFYIVLPAMTLLVVLACWLGYQTATTNLSQALSALPLYKSAGQAEKMSLTLESFRNHLFQLAQDTHELTPDNFREAIRNHFREYEDFIQELGVKKADNTGFILFRDKSSFILLHQEVAETGEHSPFKQILTYSLTPQKVSLLPAVLYTPKTPSGVPVPTGVAVMRMALPLADGTVLILGINLKEWSNLLVSSPAEAQQHEAEKSAEETLQLSYYFDNIGWILAEKSNQSKTEWRPDISRRGLMGDFGRSGYDTAFRPWTSHENYWRMVTDVIENRSGVIKESAKEYSQEFRRNNGFLCYAPIVFSSDGVTPASPVGGIAYFESIPNILETSSSLIPFFIILLLGPFLLISFAILRFLRKVARPFSMTAEELETMTKQRDLHYLRPDYANLEHAKVTSSINTLISLAKGQAEQISIMTSTIQQTHAPLPVDIESNISSALLAGEFGLVGSSAQIAYVRENIHKAAKAGTDVLVWGETGTGKELVASAIHKASPHKNGPYISINCGALDENLLMDSLFGHVAGAFSDAIDDRKGAFLAAQGGTLHLDEIGNASPKVQQSLLRALSARHIRPLGSDKEIPFDTRVVAATNVDLRQSVREGTFRQDLYYRLAIISIQTPPLRERKEDIPELAAYCILEACKALKKKNIHLSRGALRALTNHQWPGNVREFKNCLTRAVAYAEGDLVLPEHLSFDPNIQQGSAIQLPFSTISASHAAEYLWPSPSRGNFTPSQPSQAKEYAPSEVLPGTDPTVDRPAQESGFSRVKPGHNSQNEHTEPNKAHKPAIPFASPGNNGQEQSYPSHQPSPPASVTRPLYERLFEQGEINERQMDALTLAHAKFSFTRLEYEEVSGTSVSSRTIQNDLRQLVDMGLLMKSGSGPATSYQLSKHVANTER